MLDGLQAPIGNVDVDDLDVDVDAAIADACAAVEAERMRVWTPSFFDVDPETRAMATEIARLRADNVALMHVVHAKADRLPADLWTAYQDVLAASGVRDHDSARADIAYRSWCANGRKGKRPTSKLGGLLDVWNVDGKPVCCTFEGFRRAARGARTWRDLGRAVRLLSEALDISCVMPDDVVMRHVAQDAAIAALEDDGA